MALSDRIEEERRNLEARRAAEEAARDALRAKGRAMMAELNGLLEPLLKDIPGECVRWLTQDHGENTRIEISDFRQRAPSRLRRRRVSVPEIELSACPNADCTGWRVVSETRGTWSLNLELKGSDETPFAGTTALNDLAETVEWFEKRLARGIAAMQIWAEAHPVDPSPKISSAPAAERVAPPSSEAEGAAPPAPDEAKPSDLLDWEVKFLRFLKGVPLVIWLFLGFLLWVFS